MKQNNQNNPMKSTKTKTSLIKNPEIMKTKMNFLKTSVMAIALMGTTPIFAQVIPGEFPTAPTGQITLPSDLNGGLVTFDGTDESFAALGGTVMFYRPTTVNPIGSGVNLEASLDDGDGNDFSSYLWYKVSYTGGSEDQGAVVHTSTTTTFSPTNLEPGYNKFRVRGEVGTSVSCPSDEYQDVIVFVLPQLEVALSDVNGTLTYCENDVPTGANVVQLSAGTVTADYTGNGNDYPTPGETDADADFALTYHWYAIPDSAPTTTIDLGTASTPIVDLTTLTVGSPLQPDSYTFYVEVEYDAAIRNKTRLDGTDRTYVTYGDIGNATTTPVVITLTPGTPEITVVGIDD